MANPLMPGVGSSILGPSNEELIRRLTTSTSSYAKTPPPAHDIAFPESRKRMIGMRLRLAEGSLWPWPFLETHATEDKVLIFLVVKDKPVFLEDDKSLFPSDTLVTQLRLLE